MKGVVLVVFTLLLVSCQKQREPLKTKEIHTKITDSIDLKTLRISNAEAYKDDTLNVSFIHTYSDFINENEKKIAEDFIKKAIENDSELIRLFLNFSIKQSTKVIKNDNGILGILVEQSENGVTKYFTRYYENQKNKQLLASEIFAPKEKFQQFAEFVKSKNTTDAEVDFSATDENYKAFEFDKEGNVTLYFDKIEPIKLTREEVALFSHRKFREIFNLPPPMDCGKVPCVALTFDDGPSAYTPRLLDILKENDVKATFFVLGVMVERHPEILKRTFDEGHQIGNHSWNHKDFKKLTKRGVEFQVQETNAIVKEVIGQEPLILRPPYGSSNLLVAKTADMPIILWDLDTLDWSDRNAENIVQKIMKTKRNSIILAHDIHKTTIDAMPKAIKELKEKGYHFVTIEDLFYGAELEKGKKYFNRNH